MPAPEWRGNAHGMPEPPFKKRQMTKLDHMKSEHSIVFHKTIAGRYRPGEGFEAVGVLIVTWEDDDLYCHNSEVPRLKQIFEEQYHYTVHDYQIPSERSATGLALALANFAYTYDSPSKMGIVYYGGHGEFVEGRLALFAKENGDGNGDPTAFFDDALFQLKLPDTDILVILDCCFAARAFSRVEMGKRKFELLTACPPMERSPSPSSDMSFTKIVCDNLESLLKEFPSGYSTAKLYRHVYFQVQNEKRKPLLFDQSPWDYGKIQLIPAREQQSEGNGIQLIETHTQIRDKERQYYVDLSLRMDAMPTPLKMNQLAAAMQYLPHVTQLEFKHLRAPVEELEEFMRGLVQINKLRPLVTKLRARRAERKRRETCMRDEACHPSCESCPLHLQSPLHTKRKLSTMYDWGDSVLQEIPAQPTLRSTMMTSLVPMGEVADVVEEAASRSNAFDDNGVAEKVATAVK